MAVIRVGSTRDVGDLRGLRSVDRAVRSTREGARVRSATSAASSELPCLLRLKRSRETSASTSGTCVVWSLNPRIPYVKWGDLLRFDPDGRSGVGRRRNGRFCTRSSAPSTTWPSWRGAVTPSPYGGLQRIARLPPPPPRRQQTCRGERSDGQQWTPTAPRADQRPAQMGDGLLLHRSCRRPARRTRAWPPRDDFRRQAIWAERGEIGAHGACIVGVDWDVAAELVDVASVSSSERQVLAIIIALAAGAAHPVDLGNALISLDVSNASRALQALGHAAGLHARHATVVVDRHVSEEGGCATS